MIPQCVDGDEEGGGEAIEVTQHSGEKTKEDRDSEKMLLLVNVVISNDFMCERQIVVYNLILLLKKIYYFELIVCVCVYV